MVDLGRYSKADRQRIRALITEQRKHAENLGALCRATLEESKSLIEKTKVLLSELKIPRH